MKTTEEQINELDFRMLRLEAAYRQAAERRALLQRDAKTTLYMTPAQHAARTKQTAHLL